ncbi:MAG: hypothetical protein ABSG20_21940 [Bradyrhizobium sp.]
MYISIIGIDAFSAFHLGYRNYLAIELQFRPTFRAFFLIAYPKRFPMPRGGFDRCAFPECSNSKTRGLIQNIKVFRSGVTRADECLA